MPIVHRSPSRQWLVFGFVLTGSVSSASTLSIFRNANKLCESLFPPVCLLGESFPLIPALNGSFTRILEGGRRPLSHMPVCTSYSTFHFIQQARWLCERMMACAAWFSLIQAIQRRACVTVFPCIDRCNADQMCDCFPCIYRCNTDQMCRCFPVLWFGFIQTRCMTVFPFDRCNTGQMCDCFPCTDRCNTAQMCDFPVHLSL